MLKLNGKRIKNLILGKLRSANLLRSDVTNKYKYQIEFKLRFPYYDDGSGILFRPVTLSLVDLGLFAQYFMDNNILKVQWGDGKTEVTTNIYAEHTYRIKDTDRDLQNFSTFTAIIETDGKLVLGDSLSKVTEVSSDFEFVVYEKQETALDV